MVHFASSVISIWESVCDETPIFSARLVDDSGDSMTARARWWQPGGFHRQPLLDHLPCAQEVRARFEDQDHGRRPRTDLERMVLTKARRAARFRSARRPGPRLPRWKAPALRSGFDVRRCEFRKDVEGRVTAVPTPTMTSNNASATTSRRRRSDVEMSHAIIAGSFPDPKFRSEQFRRAGRHDAAPGRMPRASAMPASLAWRTSTRRA